MAHLARAAGRGVARRHDRDGQRHWPALGPGARDRENRPGRVRLDRVRTKWEDGARREDAVRDRARFERVCQALRGRARLEQGLACEDLWQPAEQLR